MKPQQPTAQPQFGQGLQLPQQGIPADQLGDQQKLLLQQLMTMSPQEIEALPPENRLIVQQLRQTVFQQNIRL